MRRSEGSCAVGDLDPRAQLLLRRYGAGPDGSPWGLTPQTAYRLVVAAEDAFDSARETPEVALEDVLPPRVLLSATDAFIARFAQCFADLAERIIAADPRSGDWSHLSGCVGEEVALAHVIEVARDGHVDGWLEEPFRAELDLLASDPERDVDFEWFADALFADRDFEVLWMHNLDGIEDDPESAHLRFVNLQPERWFLPFPGFQDR